MREELRGFGSQRSLTPFRRSRYAPLLNDPDYARSSGRKRCRSGGATPAGFAT
ncbi:MAG: hypothetical protein ACTH07_06100 [Microbacterium sp.]